MLTLVLGMHPETGKLRWYDILPDGSLRMVSDERQAEIDQQDRNAIAAEVRKVWQDLAWIDERFRA